MRRGKKSSQRAKRSKIQKQTIIAKRYYDNLMFGGKIKKRIYSLKDSKRVHGTKTKSSYHEILWTKNIKMLISP